MVLSSLSLRRYIASIGSIVSIATIVTIASIPQSLPSTPSTPSILSIPQMYISLPEHPYPPVFRCIRFSRAIRCPATLLHSICLHVISNVPLSRGIERVSLITPSFPSIPSTQMLQSLSLKGKAPPLRSPRSKRVDNPFARRREGVGTKKSRILIAQNPRL